MYKGGKNGNGTYQTIINQIPRHDIYLELFAGSAAIYKNIRAANISILCDKDKKQCESLKKSVRPGTIVLNCDVINALPILIAMLEVLKSKGCNIFLYLDPPYPFSSRSYKKPIYTHEMNDEDHIALLNGIRCATFPIAISTYNNRMYAEHLYDWRLLKYQSIVRGGNRTEYLYMNYPDPEVLHDYSFLGSNFREREAISRKVKNMQNKLNSMPVPELIAILSGVISIEKVAADIH